MTILSGVVTPTEINPVLAEVVRGPLVESRHRGAVAVVDAGGRLCAAWGDVVTPVYPRSAIKIVQALPLVESGAADRFGFDDAELALACASHGRGGGACHGRGGDVGQDRVGQRRFSLRRPLADRQEGGCGAGACKGLSGAVAQQLLREAHRRAGDSATVEGTPRGYTERSHPMQQRILGTLESLSGLDLRRAPTARDGCSVPTWALPLQSLALVLVFARLGAGAPLSEHRAAAAQRLMRAVAAHPFLVAGSGRACTEIMRVLGRRAFVKVGAEGVYCAALPGHGLGVALKCDDGAARAAEVILMALLDRLGVLEAADREALAALSQPGLKTVNGLHVVGMLQPAAALDSIPEQDNPTTVGVSAFGASSCVQEA